MKLLRTIALSSMLLASASSAMASNFYQEGQCYLFIPRIDVVAKGQVVMVTDQEVVFRTMGRIWPAAGHPAGNNITNILDKAQITKIYLDSKNRSSMEMANDLNGTEISYSRSELTGIKLDRCGK